MTRSSIGLLLGGMLLLAAAACGSPATSDTATDVVDIPEPDNADSFSSEPEAKPLVTVNLSPT